MMQENKGIIVQVKGPVVDVQFPADGLPRIQNALWVMVNGKRRVMEVAQHVGRDTVRCFLLAPSEGSGRGMEVVDSGVAVLNMHAPMEVTSKADVYEAKKGYQAFLAL